MNSKRHLLIVDGSPYVAGILVQTLKKDFNVTVAINGQEAAQLLTQGNRFDCVLTDLDLDVFSGFDLIKFIRSNRLLCHTPIVVLSAKSDSKTRIQCLELGVDNFMPKPFNPTEVKVRLLATIRRADMPVAEEAPERPVSARLLPEVESFWQNKSRILFMVLKGYSLGQSA
jgi:DNA-binding response OmpR family regulator